MVGLGVSNAPRRRAEDSLNGAPWPVRAVLVLGATTAIACYLVWVLAEDVRGGQREITQRLQAHIEGTATVGSSLASIEQEHQRSNRMLIWLLQRLCVQGARTRDEQGECFRIQ